MAKALGTPGQQTSTLPFALVYSTPMILGNRSGKTVPASLSPKVLKLDKPRASTFGLY
jgi:hypothetical protein